ncbi:alpha/beta hydrolase [Caulobacter soli]|uniref:alpha/beta hydrolase n=1 Tax=Caulobacter soli TaxID=2708539 RepID=UPI0013EA662C|nr:alpha/beta hydrolase [Caulobacter soli]
MGLYVNLRYASVGGGLRSDPYLIEGAVGDAAPRMVSLNSREAAQRVAGRSLVFTVHGFNVSYDKGLRSLARLETQLALPPNFLCVGVLWPGDFFIPAINYPGEWRDAVNGGKALARFVNTTLGGATDVSFVAHSLGCRLALEAVAGLQRKAARVCLMASATDDNCLEKPYDVSVANSQLLTWLASKKDKVLKLAYPIGDWAGDIFFGDRDSPWHGALGRYGPKWSRTIPDNARGFPIADGLGYDHGDYFPPSAPGAGGAIQPRQQAAAGFAANVLKGGAPTWP